MKKVWVLVGLVVIVAVGAFIWWNQGFKAPDPQNTEPVSFVIKPGENVRAIGNDLKEAGLIKDPVIFFLYIKKAGLDTNIQAGSYVLSPSMNLTQVVEALSSGSIDVWVRIPEGSRAEEVAEVLHATLPNYNESWDAVLLENEGRLFPDSYLIPKDAQIEDVLNIINNNFSARLNTAGLSPDDPNLDEILIKASLIEREAKFEEDRALVAGVIENRLGLGMPLQIDASAQYAIGNENDWWPEPTAEDVKIDSPYNTYVISGLPPGPIISPSLAAIVAAANPQASDYLYYVNDKSGKLHFAENLDDHNVNIERHLQ